MDNEWISTPGFAFLKYLLHFFNRAICRVIGRIVVRTYDVMSKVSHLQDLLEFRALKLREDHHRNSPGSEYHAQNVSSWFADNLWIRFRPRQIDSNSPRPLTSALVARYIQGHSLPRPIRPWSYFRRFSCASLIKLPAFQTAGYRFFWIGSAMPDQ